MPLEFPQNPERYDLFMIDEYESQYAPDTDMGPRNPNEEIGEFTSLAFIKKRTIAKNLEALAEAKKEQEA